MRTVSFTSNGGDLSQTVSGVGIAELPGDVNRDGQVDALDLAAVAAALSTKQGDPNYTPGADLNGDGIVDIFDLVQVGRNFGRR